jgi:hypothetical protein
MYNATIQKAWRRIPKPVNHLTVAIVEYPDALFVRVYENEIMGYSEGDRVKIMTYLEEVRKTIEMFGIQAHIEGIAGDAPRAK